MAFIDVTCPKCKKRFGFSGKMIDRPPCPKCKHVVPLKELEEAEAEMDKIRKEFEMELEARASNDPVQKKKKRNNVVNSEAWDAGFD